MAEPQIKISLTSDLIRQMKYALELEAKVEGEESMGILSLILALSVSDQHHTRQSTSSTRICWDFQKAGITGAG
jgi:hypothetical protein